MCGSVIVQDILLPQSYYVHTYRKSLYQGCSLVLSSVNAGQHSTCTYSVARMATANYAEKNSDFIFYIFENKWATGGLGLFEVTKENMKAIGSPFDCGLYLFYLQRPSDEKKYPVYIGYTGRNFRTRFSEHATRDNGVINKCICSMTFQPSGGPYKLFVLTKSFEPIAAKVIESIFLNAFNFALNTEENGSTRPDLDLLPREFTKEESYESFKETYQRIMLGIQDIARQHFSDMGLEPSKTY